MSHLDAGTIVSLRDGAPVVGDAIEHLGSCAHCRLALEEARRRAELIATSLSALDRPVDLEAAKAAVRARLHPDRRSLRAPVRTTRHLGRAAGILLLAAGAAYAIPGSPVRSWIVPEPSISAPTIEVVTPAQAVESQGAIEVGVPDGLIRVALHGVAVGSDVEVAWIDRASARIEAAPGSSFSFGEGRAEATVARGPVRVELPRSARIVSLEVDGTPYLRRTSAGLVVLQPVQEQTDDLVRFVIRER